jgi:hypothetical protein
MPHRSSKPRDLNSLARAIVVEATEGGSRPPDEGKNLAAVALGRRGGLKGGPARAKALSAKRRKAIAAKAAAARWKGKRKAP